MQSVKSTILTGHTTALIMILRPIAYVGHSLQLDLIWSSILRFSVPAVPGVP